jgi:bifunctional non-homologous end joining protein LigD
MEGIVSMRAEAAYVGGRTRAWLKIKSYQLSELEVAACWPSAASRRWR